MAEGTKRDQALERLERLPEEQRLAALNLIVKKRKATKFISYFEPWLEQIEALKRFTKEIKVFGLLGGNRSGKSELGAFLAVAWALGKDYFKGDPAYEFVKDLPIPEGPNNIWVVGLSFAVLRDVIWYEKLRHGKNHPPFLPDDGTVENVKDGDFQVFFKNGSIITGKSADAGRDKFQGASIDLVWIDEECEADVYDECYQRTVDCAGKIILTLTPLVDVASGVRVPWVFDLYTEFQQGAKNLVFCQLSMLNSPFVPVEEKEAAQKKWAGHPEEGARLYGKFVRRSGLVYPEWNSAKHIITPFSIPRHWQRIVTIDPAATGVTAALWLAVDDYGNIYAYREYYEREKIVSEHAKSIKIRCMGEPIDIWLLDPKWGSQRNAETHKTGAQLWREQGIPVRLPDVGEDFGLNVSREYINATLDPSPRHPKFFVFSGLGNFIFEISNYTWDSFGSGPQKGLTKEKPRKRHDHLLNAWQYACAIRPSAKATLRKANLLNSTFMAGSEWLDDSTPIHYNSSSYT